MIIWTIFDKAFQIGLIWLIFHIYFSFDLFKKNKVFLFDWYLIGEKMCADLFDKNLIREKILSFLFHLYLIRVKEYVLVFEHYSYQAFFCPSLFDPYLIWVKFGHYIFDNYLILNYIQFAYLIDIWFDKEKWYLPTPSPDCTLSSPCLALAVPGLLPVLTLAVPGLVPTVPCKSFAVSEYRSLHSGTIPDSQQRGVRVQDWRWEGRPQPVEEEETQGGTWHWQSRTGPGSRSARTGHLRAEPGGRGVGSKRWLQGRTEGTSHAEDDHQRTGMHARARLSGMGPRWRQVAQQRFK